MELASSAAEKLRSFMLGWNWWVFGLAVEECGIKWQLCLFGGTDDSLEVGLGACLHLHGHAAKLCRHWLSSRGCRIHLPHLLLSKKLLMLLC